MPLHIVQGSPPPDTPAEKLRRKIRARPKPPEMLQCPRCGSREIVQVKIGMYFKNGKAIGGTPQWLCATCQRNGERVVIV